MRLAFLGTPSESVASLLALVQHGHEVTVVVTRPDRRRSRGGPPTPSPVKAAAAALGIPVVHRVSELVAAEMERGVVVAYGAMIPGSVLARTPMLNVHFSLLPRWRGAAPVERAILAGDEHTGVSIMSLEETLDTGPVHLERRISIGEATVSELRATLGALGAQTLVEVLDDPDRLAHPVPQAGPATYAAKIGPADLHLSAAMSAEAVARVVRLERAWLLADGRRLLVLAVRPIAGPRGLAGTITNVDGAVVLNGATDAVAVEVVRPEGSRTMSALEWWRGRVATTKEAVWA